MKKNSSMSEEEEEEEEEEMGRIGKNMEIIRNPKN